jgi:hypothetical protein
MLTQGSLPGAPSTSAAATSSSSKKSAKKAAKSAKRQAKQQQPPRAASEELRRAAGQRRRDLCSMLREWARLLFRYALAHPEPRGILLHSWGLLDLLNVRPPLHLVARARRARGRWQTCAPPAPCCPGRGWSGKVWVGRLRPNRRGAGHLLTTCPAIVAMVLGRPLQSAAHSAPAMSPERWHAWSTGGPSLPSLTGASIVALHEAVEAEVLSWPLTGERRGVA